MEMQICIAIVANYKPSNENIQQNYNFNVFSFL